MKLQKYFLVLIILFVSFQISFGQERPIARQVDEFGILSNDDLQARVDNLMRTLNQNNSQGYIILHGTKGNPLAKYINERRIKGCLLMMKYDVMNLSFVLTEDKAEIGGQFWEIPKDAEKPEFNETPKDYKLSNLTKPQKLYALNVEDDFCPLHFDLQFYSLFLNADLSITGKIIIYEKSVKLYQKEKQKYLQELTKSQNVSPQQLRFVRGKYYGTPDAEFWIVPRKKR